MKKKQSNKRSKGVPLSVDWLLPHRSSETEEKWVMASFYDHCVGPGIPLWEPTLQELLTHMGPEACVEVIPDAISNLCQKGFLCCVNDNQYRCMIDRLDLTRYMFDNHRGSRDEMLLVFNRLLH